MKTKKSVGKKDKLKYLESNVFCFSLDLFLCIDGTLSYAVAPL